MKNKIIILAGIMLLQVALAFVLIKMLAPKSSATGNDPQKSEQQAKKGAPVVKKVYAKGEEIPMTVLQNSAVLALEDLVVNPSGSEGKRYLVISIYVYVQDKAAQDELDAKKPAISDALNTLLSGKNYEWLSDVSNREILRGEIRAVIEKLLENTKVLRIYITKYVMQ